MNNNYPFKSRIDIDIFRFKQNVTNIIGSLNNSVRYMQVVKADAYGHGAVEIARAAIEIGVEYLGVANSNEGKELRENGIKTEIIILGPSLIEEIPDILKYDLTPSISDIFFAKHLNSSTQKKIRVHIELDTGMGRGGFLLGSIDKLGKELKKLDNLIYEGIFSHFPDADRANDFTLEQIEKFRSSVTKLKFLDPKYIHIANSAGILNYPGSLFNMVRIGILSYGYYPAKECIKKIKVLPIMSFRSKVSLIKSYSAGSTISYARTFKTKKRTDIAVIPVGYADGVHRILSNNSTVIINSQKFPVIGNISMDMIIADISDASNKISIGDETILMGYSGVVSLSADDIAKSAKTINYEILTSMGRRGIRFYNDTIMEKKKQITSVKRKLALNDLIRDTYGMDLSEELLEKLHGDYLKGLFGNAWDTLKEDFQYKIDLKNIRGNYYRANIKISFKKWLSEKILKIAAVSDEQKLERMMKDKNYIYRWYLDKENIKQDDFKLISISIDGNNVNYTQNAKNNIIEYVIKNKIEVRNRSKIEMDIETVYKKKNRLFPVYFSDFTKNAEIRFSVENTKISCFPFFTGSNIKPRIINQGRTMTIIIKGKKYIYPESGLIFYWED